MFKSLLRSNGILRQVVDKEYRQFKHEDVGYVAAFLSKLRTSKTDLDTIYNELNVLECSEHWEIAKGDHLEQIFGTRFK